METAGEDAGGGIPSPGDETCQALSIQPVLHAYMPKKKQQHIVKKCMMQIILTTIFLNNQSHSWQVKFCKKTHKNIWSTKIIHFPEMFISTIL